jgi:hypothetical protein
MKRFWKRKGDDARSVGIALEQRAWPLITTTSPEKFVVSYANGATGTYWGPRMMTPTFSSGQSTTSTTHLPERSFTVSDTRQYDAVTVEAIAADDASAAVVRYQGIAAYGSAKRNKHERKNADTGLELAIGRAFVNLGQTLQKRGLKRIGD